jgi:hypothetical protein
MPTSFTNGDSAVPLIKQAGIQGKVVPWRDVLHEGPVPAGLSLEELRSVRAAFLAHPGWNPYDQVLMELAERDDALARAFDGDEVILWFEHDLYDQLQLLQILDWCATRVRGAYNFNLVCNTEYIGRSTPARLAERYLEKSPISTAHIDLAVAAWAAFRSSDPVDLSRFLIRSSMALPWVAPALRRHLQQFPAVTNGLSRSQQQALEVIASGTSLLRQVYPAAHHQREDAVWLGDTTFASHLEELVACPVPLVARPDGVPLHSIMVDGSAFWLQQVQLTEAGKAVVRGEADHIDLNGIDKWLGGAQLTSHRHWRWDEDGERLVVV